MKKLIFLLLVLCIPHVSNAQNADESKPTAVVTALKAISDSFLPGVFDTVKGVLGNIQENKKNKEDLDKAKKQISDLGTKSAEMRKTTLTTLNDIKAYYDAESNDFKTINEFYMEVIKFSTRVNSLVVISDIITSPDVGFDCEEAEIQLIIRFKDAARNVVNNFNINEKNLISDNSLLNNQIRTEKRKIDNVIERIKGSNLASVSTTDMNTKQIDDYFKLVADIKNNGTYKFIDIENSVFEIQTLLGTYLTDFSKKTDKISANIDKTVSNLKE